MQVDAVLKDMIRRSAGVMAGILFGSRVVEWVNVEQPKPTTLRVDLLARLATGELRHVELQSDNDPDIGWRENEYYCGFWRILREHVDQVMLYAGKDPLTMPDVWITKSTTHRYTIIDMRTIPGEPLLESDNWGDNILALLTAADKQKVLGRVDEQLARLRGEERTSAARSLVVVSGIVGLEKEVRERQSMIDIMKNQIIGPAIQEGLDRGRIEGQEQSARRVLRRVLTKRFGELPPDAARKLERAGVDALERWIERAFSAQSLQQVFRSRAKA